MRKHKLTRAMVLAEAATRVGRYVGGQLWSLPGFSLPFTDMPGMTEAVHAGVDFRYPEYFDPPARFKND